MMAMHVHDKCTCTYLAVTHVSSLEDVPSFPESCYNIAHLYFPKGKKVFTSIIMHIEI